MAQRATAQGVIRRSDYDTPSCIVPSCARCRIVVAPWFRAAAGFSRSTRFRRTVMTRFAMLKFCRGGGYAFRPCSWRQGESDRLTRLVIREVFRGSIDQVGKHLIFGTIWNRTENGTESDWRWSPSTEAAGRSRDRTDCKELQIAASKPCKLHRRFSPNP